MNRLKHLMRLSSCAMYFAVIVIFVCSIGVLSVVAEGGEEIAIAAASDLNFAIKEIIAEFEKVTGKHVKLSLGSSGNFYAQIQNGAPFDLYFSADIGYPKKLEEAGFTVPGSLYRYAVGRIVLWTNHDSHRDVSKGMEILRDPAIKKIAIANPKHAPYGRAAVAAMEHFKVYEQVKSKLVLGENVSQTAQFAQSGNADVALISLAQALSDTLKSSGRYALVPTDSYPALDQAATVVRTSQNKQAAHRFLEFMQTPTAQKILSEYGFETRGLEARKR